MSQKPVFNVFPNNSVIGGNRIVIMNRAMLKDVAELIEDVDFDEDVSSNILMAFARRIRQTIRRRFTKNRPDNAFHVDSGNVLLCGSVIATISPEVVNKLYANLIDSDDEVLSQFVSSLKQGSEKSETVFSAAFSGDESDVTENENQELETVS